MSRHYYRSYLIILVLLLAFPAAYTKQIGREELIITAPRTERIGDDVYFYSDSGQQDVILEYGKTIIRAGEMCLDEDDNKIHLSNGFYSKYLNNAITGEQLEYDANNNYMDGQNIAITTEDLDYVSRSMSFHGEKLALRYPTLGLTTVDFAMKAKRMDIYPGWGVIYGTTFNWRDRPFWYIPVYVIDKRRNAFEMPGAFPRIGYSFFNEDYIRFNNHYYINEYSYGNLQIGYSVLKGIGYGMQNILRFSDYDQMTYINENWQYWNTSERFSYEHSFLQLPYEDGKKLTFNELLQYNEEAKNAAAHSLRLNHTVYEEVGQELIDRDFELEYYARGALPWLGITAYSLNTYTDVYEITSDTAGARWQSYTEFARGFDIPDIATIGPGVGYDTVKYSLPPYNWHRVFSFLSVRRKWWIFEGNVRIYDYIDERGSSPFYFDSPHQLGDNVRGTMAMRFWDFYFGKTERYLIYNGRVRDRKYFLEYTSRPWTLHIDYDVMENSWWAGLSASF